MFSDAVSCYGVVCIATRPPTKLGSPFVGYSLLPIQYVTCYSPYLVNVSIAA
jgi:hypothetical protein